jgi:hypothetical protein
MHDFDAFCTSLASCRKCRDLIPTIGDLPENEFKFHWRPYLRGLPPLRFLFLGWEPSWPKSWQDVEEGIFSEPLQFAIREFLLPKKPEAGFMITNMAQCSMKTGDLCNKTRTDRFTACSEFLKEQILWARGGSSELNIVAIGWKPIHFLKSHPDVLWTSREDCRVHRISHYSPQCNPYFHRFARERSHDFDAFSGTIRSRYEAFIQSKEFHKYGLWYREHPALSKSDLERLFMWKSEMMNIFSPEGH